LENAQIRAAISLQECMLAGVEVLRAAVTGKRTQGRLIEFGQVRNGMQQRKHRINGIHDGHDSRLCARAGK
jgi:hypothetical protein